MWKIVSIVSLQRNLLTVFHVLCFWQYPWIMESLHGSPLSANSNSISSAILSQVLCGLFSEENHFFSELDPMKDHWQILNLLESTFTDSAFFKHSSLLPFLSQEMSLNIDMSRILPVKVSDGSPKSLKIIDFITKLQRCESWHWYHHNLCTFSRIWSHAILFLQASLDSGCWRILPKHNTESEKT